MRGMAITLAVTLLLILSISIFSGRYSRFVSEEMQGQMENMEPLIRNGDFAGARQMQKDMMKAWQERSDLISMWVNHGDVDDVSSGFRRLETALSQEEPFYSLLYAAELKEALSHIYHRDALMLKNIF